MTSCAVGHTYSKQFVNVDKCTKYLSATIKLQHVEIEGVWVERCLPSFPSSLSFHLSLVFHLCHSSRENPCLRSFLGDPCLQGDHSPPSFLSVLVDQEYQEDLVGLVHHLYQLWRGRGKRRGKEKGEESRC